MVQEFKDYDKLYSKFKGKFMPYETGQGFCEMMAEADQIKNWPYKVGSYSNAQIREAVYFASGAEECQLLMCVEAFQTYPELLRIDNYLGALVRGGQLDTNHNVQR